jgi:hypothetical protein
MKLKQLLEQLNQLSKERPEALEMEVVYDLFGDGTYEDSVAIKKIGKRQNKIMLGMSGKVIKSCSID